MVLDDESPKEFRRVLHTHLRAVRKRGYCIQLSSSFEEVKQGLASWSTKPIEVASGLAGNRVRVYCGNFSFVFIISQNDLKIFMDQHNGEIICCRHENMELQMDDEFLYIVDKRIDEKRRVSISKTGIFSITM